MPPSVCRLFDQPFPIDDHRAAIVAGDRVLPVPPVGLGNDGAAGENEAITRPLEVDGVCAVLTSDGTVVKEGTKVFLCRCGHSANKPMCDGSHKREGFIAS